MDEYKNNDPVCSGECENCSVKCENHTDTSDNFNNGSGSCNGDCESCTGDCASCAGHTANYVKPSRRSMYVFGILTAVCIIALIVIAKIFNVTI